MSGTGVAVLNKAMRNQEEQIGSYDISLAVLVATAAWLLIFQSGLFGR
jgi:hypothetical protein